MAARTIVLDRTDILAVLPKTERLGAA